MSQMINKEIFFRAVYDKDGDFNHLELCQGDQVIRITFKQPSSTADSSKWITLKKLIDKIEEGVRRESTML